VGRRRHRHDLLTVGHRGRPHGAAVLAVAFTGGAVPFANLAARRVAGVDLRDVGRGTVSGTGLYRVAGFAPLAVAGVLDVAKGAAGPLLAGPGRPWLGAAATAGALTGHNWSPLLGGAGGRGVAPALGATLVRAPEGTVLLLASLVAGRAIRQTGLATLAGTAGLVPLLWHRRGGPGAATALGVLVPMTLKRLCGDAPPARGWPTLRRAGWSRLLFDREPPVAAGVGGYRRGA
jgi:acyl phosphate:glycerol-3-phosphate acyltransferase